MKNFILLCFGLVNLTIFMANAQNPQSEPSQKSEDAIRIYEKNPWYWQYKGEPVLLRGGTDDDNLWQWSGKKLTDHLDLLSSLGGNYVRNTMSDRDEGNESSLGAEWENHWAAYIKENASKANKEIYLTSMNLVPSSGVRHVLTHRNLYDFVEISQNNQDSKGARGRAHYENVVKWKNIFAGAASVRFHRPEGYWGMGLTERAQVNIKAMDMFLEAFDIFSAGPYEGIKLIAESEGYAMANLGKSYAVYFPAGRYAAELDPWIYAKKVRIKSLDIDSATWSEEKTMDLEWEDEWKDLFGFQHGISLSTPENRACVFIIEIAE